MRFPRANGTALALNSVVIRFRTGVVSVLLVAGAVAVRNHWDAVALPFRVARIYARPADRHIAMPVAGVRPSSVADTWHAPRGRDRKHEGQDIFAPRGTPVVSATDGVVLRLGGGTLGGNAVFVAGPGRRTYYYAHLDRYAPAAAPGTIVLRGTVLGYVGNTGNARNTPPHLHFGVYAPSGAINPLPLIVPGAEDTD